VNRVALKLAGFALAWAVMFSAASAFAQPVVTRGGALKKRAYQTYGTISLFVDGTLGSDSNPCTASGASACATFAAAMAKVPRFIQHNVTIAIAAGTYTEAFAITDRKLTNNVSITVTGAQASFAVATGTNSGTSTAATAATTASPATMTDSGQAWTVNNLRGRFVVFSSGALSGQTIPIASNTATTLTLATSNTPGVGSAYTIQSPSVIFAAAGTTPYRLSAIDGSGTISLSDLDFSRTGTGVNFSLAGSETTLVSVSRSRFVASATNTIAISAVSGSLSLTNCHVQALSSSGALSCTATGIAGSGAIACTSSNTNFVAAAGAALFLNNAKQSVFSSSPMESDGASGVLTVTGSNNVRLGGVWLTCAGGASSGLSTSTSSQPPVPSYITSTGTLAVSGCTDGILLYGAAWLRTSLVAITSATRGVSLTSGARVDFLLQVPTFTTVTNEIQLDSTNYTYSFLSGLSPAVISNSYGTTVIK
jgi:hypothetical protein